MIPPVVQAAYGLTSVGDFASTARRSTLPSDRDGSPAAALASCSKDSRAWASSPATERPSSFARRLNLAGALVPGSGVTTRVLQRLDACASGITSLRSRAA